MMRLSYTNSLIFGLQVRFVYEEWDRFLNCYMKNIAELPIRNLPAIIAGRRRKQGK